MPPVIIVHRYDKMNLIVNHIDCKYTGYNKWNYLLANVLDIVKKIENDTCIREMTLNTVCHLAFKYISFFNLKLYYE